MARLGEGERPPDRTPVRVSVIGSKLGSKLGSNRRAEPLLTIRRPLGAE